MRRRKGPWTPSHCLLGSVKQPHPLGVLVALLQCVAVLFLLSACIPTEESNEQELPPTQEEKSTSSSTRDESDTSERSEGSEARSESEANRQADEEEQKGNQSSQQANQTTIRSSSQSDNVSDAESQVSAAVIHVVQSGDTLSAIAREYGVALRDLMDINSIDDPNALRVGQELIIPLGFIGQVCQSDEGKPYVTGLRSITARVLLAADILSSEMRGATPSSRGSGEWSGLVTTATLDLFEAAEDIVALGTPDALNALHGQALALANDTSNAAALAMNFIASTTNDSSAASSASIDLADAARALQERIAQVCPSPDTSEANGVGSDSDGCPSQDEDAYFRVVGQNILELDEALLDLNWLTERFGADLSLIEDPTWRSDLLVVLQSISDIADALVLLNTPDNVRHGLVLDIVHFAEDVQAAAVTYRLAIENESPDLFITAGEDFQALQTAAARISTTMSSYCDMR